MKLQVITFTDHLRFDHRGFVYNNLCFSYCTVGLQLGNSTSSYNHVFALFLSLNVLKWHLIVVFCKVKLLKVTCGGCRNNIQRSTYMSIRVGSQ